MESNALLQLESAAKIMLAPPSMITPAQRMEAEQFISSFRQTKSPYGLVKHIMENTTVDYVLFECACTIKEALIKEWNHLPDQDKIGLRQYLFEYVLQKQSPPFVRDKVLQVIAIMVKRESVTDFGAMRSSIIGEIQKLILEGEMHQQILGCCFLTALMQEHGNTVKSSDIGLTWETHFKIKKQFEASDLKTILTICIRALSELQLQECLLKHLLSLSEAVFGWGYISVKRHLSKSINAVYESKYQSELFPSLKLTPQWRALMIDNNVYWKIRDNPHLAHYALNCLVQLASLNGTLINNKQDRLQYFSTYIDTFVKFVSSIKVFDREALGISNIIRNIVTYFPPTLMVDLPPLLMKSFMEKITQLTCIFAQEGSIDADESSLYTEGFETLLKVWLTLIGESKSILEDFVSQASWEIFSTYLKGHLYTPSGTRAMNFNEPEDQDAETSDRFTFKDQLQAIGTLGRQVPKCTLPVLCQLLEERVSDLSKTFEALASGNNTSDATRWLNSSFDDLQWILLISGHLLSLESSGEPSLVPSELMRYSIEQQANLDVTLKLLVSPLIEVQGMQEAADHIVRCVAAVLRLCDVEKKAVESKMHFSTEISETLVWFLRNWSQTYLLPNEVCYYEISMALSCAFGLHSEGAMWTVNYLMDKIDFNLTRHKSEPGIIEETVMLLLSLVDLRDKASFVLKSDGFSRLVRSYQMMNKSEHQVIVNGGVMKAFVLGGAGLEGNKREEYWAQIILPPLEKMNNILNEENFKKSYQDVQKRQEIKELLETFLGIAQGGRCTTVHSIFALISPLLSQCAHLTALYCNYQSVIEVILALFSDCAKAFLCYLTHTESRIFYQACLNVVQMYARSNLGRSSIDPNAEEETFNDIYLLLELFLHLLPKDFIDLSPPDELNTEPPITAADVCLYGLKILMPLMTIDLLKFPTLAFLYYKMIVFVCELYPEKIIAQEQPLVEGMLRTVQLGLQTFGKEVNSLCCDFVQVLGTHVFTARKSTSFKLLMPFIEYLMDMILRRQVNSDVLPSMGMALFVLMCCHQEEYQRCVQACVNAQSDPQIRDRLASSFVQLTSNLVFDTDRQQKARFKEAFEKFVIEVPGFLLVK